MVVLSCKEFYKLIYGYHHSDAEFLEHLYRTGKARNSPESDSQGDITVRKYGIAPIVREENLAWAAEIGVLCAVPLKN